MVSKSKNSKFATLGMCIFGFIFFAAGSFFMWFMGLKPLVLSLQSSDWPQVACTITRSYVDSRSDSDGTTYKAIIDFRYRVNNVDYTSNTYNFDQSYSSNRGANSKIVNKNKVGQTKECWVNPNSASHAVIDRSIPGIVWFTIPFSSIFVMIGGAVILGAFGLFPQSWKLRSSSHTRVQSDNQGYTQLTPSMSAKRSLLFFLFFASFWNGIVSIFVYQVWLSFVKQRPEWGLAVFISLFVIIGLGLALKVIHSFLALFNPKPTLSLNEGSPHLGQKIQLQWEFSGNSNKITHYSISLEACEKATYRVGTDTKTETQIFYTETLFSANTPPSDMGNSVSLTIPANSIHTFTAAHNKIEWRILIHCNIPRWPDIKQEYPFVVRPLPN